MDEFVAGLTIEEIQILFAILNKYKVLHDEPEEDIVTELWDANMAHIKYDAKEADNLVAKALNHSSPKVRRCALRRHLESDDPCLEEICKTIDDPDLTTRSGPACPPSI